ncbi:hypothetical protein B0T10DRAFT_585332 [Thelonectria olida]|uniref:Uncharacterized protein n=1 Tax=Thelonectria olida TaxID=1576542 RepID=A0A9P8VWP1_9HYPO|nr:hypothetical protein B0T10DRAFT_585332 [Thelonectria olida]
MTSQLSSLILQMPLHIVAECLGRLSSGQQLGSAILSHRIFYDAFKESRTSICHSIVKLGTRAIPDEVLPFAMALLEAQDVGPGDDEAVRQLAGRMHRDILKPRDQVSQLLRLSEPQLRQLGETHALIESLMEHLVEEALPAFISCLEPFDFHRPLQISHSEEVRLTRAFYRFQLTCDLALLRKDLSIEYAEWCDLFFNPFSHWVHEQMVCVAEFLGRKLFAAYEDVAAHAVEYGKECPAWELGLMHPDAHGHLLRGLPLLLAIVEAQTFEERLQLLPSTLTYQRKDFNGELDPSGWTCFRQFDPELEEYYTCSFQDEIELQDLNDDPERRDVLKCFFRPLDGKYDAEASGPHKTWFASRKYRVIGEILSSCFDANLRDIGYVLWDDTKIGSEDLQNIFDEYGKSPRLLGQLLYDWPEDKKGASQWERLDMLRAGGSGYWPGEGFDFSRITGLSESQKEEFVDLWTRSRRDLAARSSQAPQPSMATMRWNMENWTNMISERLREQEESIAWQNEYMDPEKYNGIEGLIYASYGLRKGDNIDTPEAFQRRE